MLRYFSPVKDKQTRKHTSAGQILAPNQLFQCPVPHFSKERKAFKLHK